MNTISKLDSLLANLIETRDNLLEEINDLPLSDHHWDKFHETVMDDLNKSINSFEDFINDFEDDQSKNN